LNDHGTKKPAFAEKDAPKRTWRQFDASSVHGGLRVVGIRGANADPLKDNRLRQMGANFPNFELQAGLTGCPLRRETEDPRQDRRMNQPDDQSTAGQHQQTSPWNPARPWTLVNQRVHPMAIYHIVGV
jgi:hypothetical protein